jgi:hypothetical protein
LKEQKEAQAKIDAEEFNYVEESTEEEPKEEPTEEAN